MFAIAIFGFLTILSLFILFILDKFQKFSFIPISIFIVVIIFNSFTIVPSGHVGVQAILGTVKNEVLTEGFHLINPITNIIEMDVRIVKAELNNSNGGTKDLQVIHTDLVVNYRKIANKAAYIYKELGADPENAILFPAINESFKAITAKYNSEELITKRDEVSAAIVNELTNKVSNYGFSITGISLVNFGFSKEYQESIEAKVIATQNKLKAEQDLVRIKVEAEQRIAQAEGEAKAIAIQAKATQTSGGSLYVQLEAIKKWDGKLPTTMTSNEPTPFININK